MWKFKFLGDRFFAFSTNLFGFFAVIDPANTLFGLKTPTFLLFLLLVALKFKPHFSNLRIVALLIILQFVSCSFGLLIGMEFDSGINKQYILFYFLLLIICWSYKIDLLPSIIWGSFVVSVMTIIGYITIMMDPDFKLLIYHFSEDHGTILMTGERTFLGVTFYALFYRSLPLVTIPAAIYFNKFLDEKTHRKKNFLISLIFLTSLFMGGNRAMLLGVFIIIMIPIYLKYKRLLVFNVLIIIVILFGLIIAYLAITDKEEASTMVKTAHLISYSDYFSRYWYTLLFGTGAGSMFFSKGIDAMTPITEWTYLDILRMNGVAGLTLFLTFLFKPIIKNWKRREIRYWSKVSSGYILYMFLAGSNPNIFCSTGILVIIFLYSYSENLKYRMT